MHEQPLAVGDFEKQPRGPYEFNIWRANQTVDTPFGSFSIEAITPLKDKEPPDDVMLLEATRLRDFVRKNHPRILAKIHEHYRTVSQDSNWMEFCDVPIGLSRDELKPFLVALDISVDREESEPTILITPQWDEEHAIYLAIREGELTFSEP